MSIKNLLNNTVNIKLSIIFCFVMSTMYSQNTIKGKVVDKTNESIPFANIIVSELTSDKIIFGTVSNENGGFEIVLKNENTDYKVTVSFIGYKKVSKNVSEMTTGNSNIFKLTTLENQLDEVIIKASVPTIVRKEDKLVFNVEKSPLKSGFKGMEVLKNTPSIWVDENEAIRMRNEEATVLINGRKLNMSSEMLSTYINSIPSSNIKAIEIQSNKSSEIDATSTGGVINIILKEKETGLNAQIAPYFYYYGDKYNEYGVDLNWNYGSETWNIYGVYNYGNDISFQYTEDIVNFSETNLKYITDTNIDTDTENHNYQLGFVKILNKKHKIGLEVYGSVKESKNVRNGLTSIFSDDLLYDEGVISRDRIRNQNTINGTFNYTFEINEKEQLSIISDYTNRKTDEIIDFESNYGISDDNVNNRLSKASTNLFSLQADYLKKVNKDTSFSFGTKFSNSDRDNNVTEKTLTNGEYIIDIDESTLDTYNETIFATYGSFNKTFSDKNFIKIGIRVENTNLKKEEYLISSLIKQDYTDVFPTLYYSRELGKDKIATSYSRSLRRPRFSQLSNYTLKTNDYQYRLGNPNLTPEYVDKFEVNYDFKKNSFSIYYTNVSDAINGIYTTENDIVYYQQKNEGNQIQYGVEYKFSKSIKKWLFLNFSSFLYNRKFVSEERNSLFKKTTYGGQLFTNFKFNKTTSLDFSGRYLSPRTDAYYEFNGFHTFNLAFNKVFLEDKLNLKIYFDDIFNSLIYEDERIFDSYQIYYKEKPKSRFIGFQLTYNFSNNAKILKKKNTSKNDNKRRL